MTVSSDGNSIEGKYFNQLGASGPERYERIEEANEAKSKPDVAVDKADNEVSE